MKEFINRKKERMILSSILNFENDTDKITNKNLLVIYGNEGIGKSQLIEHIAQKMKIQNQFIIIEGFTQNKNCKEYYHFDLLLAKMENRTKTNFSWHFISNRMIGATKSYISEITKSLIKFKEDPISEKINILKHNLRIYKKGYIYFKNAQNIEQESLDIFYNLSKEFKDTMFIFEYTCNEDEFLKIRKDIKNKSQLVEYLEVKSIVFQEIESLFDFTCVSQEQKEKIELYYQECNGNLDKTFYKYGNLLKNKKSIFNYANCDFFTKVLLQVINLSVNAITIKTLTNILNDNSQLANIAKQDASLLNQSNLSKQNIFYKINELLMQGIISNKQETLTISNTLSEELALYLSTPESFYAYQSLISHYRFEDDCISLFKLYCLFGDNQIIQILPQVKKYYITKKYPETFLKDLEQYLNDREPNEYTKAQERIILFMVELCIHSNYYKKGCFYLNKIFNPKNPAHILMKAGLLSIVEDSFDKALSELDLLLLNHFQKESREAFIINLYKLQIYMEHKSQTEISHFINTMFAINKYKEYQEYYYLLRNYAEITDWKKSNQLYFECLSSRLVTSDSTFVYGINLSLAMNYAHKGDLQNAKKYTTNARFGINNGIREYYILNNESVIEMLNGNFDLKVLEALNYADLFNKNPYDKIIISCNLLVYYTHQKMFSRINLILNYLLSLDMDHYNYGEIKHIYYQNLLYYYETIENEEKVKEYEKKIETLLSTIDKNSYTYQIASLQLSKKIDNTIYFSSFRFRIDFLGYWDFNFPLDDFL